MNVRELIDRHDNAVRVDAEREDAVRRFHCPVCGAVPREACRDEVRIAYAHTGRYRVAADAGAVPPLVGAP